MTPDHRIPSRSAVRRFVRPLFVLVMLVPLVLPAPAQRSREPAAPAADRPADPGRVTTRRLNRAEYNNTIRDLLGVDLMPADDFPQDDSGYGFDNIGDVLSLSPALMEKYLTAADRVARVALFGVPPLAPTLTRLRSDGRRSGDAHAFPAQYD